MRARFRLYYRRAIVGLRRNQQTVILLMIGLLIGSLFSPWVLLLVLVLLASGVIRLTALAILVALVLFGGLLTHWGSTLPTMPGPMVSSAPAPQPAPPAPEPVTPVTVPSQPAQPRPVVREEPPAPPPITDEEVRQITSESECRGALHQRGQAFNSFGEVHWDGAHCVP